MARVVWALLLMVGCGEPAPPPAPIAPSPAPAAPAPAAPAASAEPTAPNRVATVLEVHHAGVYTYARMDACGVEAWVAGPKADYEVGQAVSMIGGMPMTDFKAESLDRVFEVILFVDSWKVTDEVAPCIPQARALPKAAANDLVQGIARDTVDAAGYTYVLLDNCGSTAWVAAPPSQVVIGDSYSVPQGFPMTNFHSAALERTFEYLVLATTLRKVQPPDCSF